MNVMSWCEGKKEKKNANNKYDESFFFFFNEAMRKVCFYESLKYELRHNL